ncbi:MAG: hypothetical protein M3O74_11130 [Pseudomonadota bacterium]|nr:hypothetical protein [Pseudomonadota bacterium]
MNALGNQSGLSQQKIKSFSYEKIADVRPANVSAMPRKITKLHDDLTECSFVVQV